MQPFRNLSILQRISVLTLSIVLLSVWGLTWYASATLRRDMESLISQQQASTARFVADEVERALERRFASLQRIADDMLRTGGFTPEATAKHLIIHPPEADLFNAGITVLNAQGRVVGDSFPGAGRIGVDYSELETLTQALQRGRPNISAPMIGKKLKTPIFAMTIPLRDAGGTVVGALSGITQMGLPNFLDPIQRSPYGSSGNYLLIDRAHRIILTASDSSRIMEALPPVGINPTIDRFTAGADGVATLVNTHGTEVQVAVHQIEGADWYVAVTLPTAEAFAPVRNMQRRVWMAGVLITLLALLLIRWVLTRQMHPAMDAVRQVVERIQQVQQGSPVTPFQAPPAGDFARLMEAFNALLQAQSERKAMLREVLNTSTVGIFATDAGGCITLANEAVAHIFGLSVQEMLGRSYTDLLKDINSAEPAVTPLPLQGQEQTRRLQRADGSAFWAHVSLRPFLSDAKEQRGLVAVVSDISAQVNAHDYEQFRRHTLELLARNSPLHEVFDAIVRGVEALRPQSLCSILQLSADGKHLEAGSSPSLPAFYNDAIDGVEIGPYVGSCGAAAYRGTRVVVSDILAHPNWVAFRDLASKADLRACWSQPLLDSAGVVLGTIAVYHRTPQEPQSQDIELIEQAAHLACLAIAQHRSAQSLHASQERFRLIMENTPGVAVRGYKADGTLVYWNTSAEQLYGYSAAEVLGKNLFTLLLAPQAQEHMRQAVAQSVASGTPQAAGELALRHKEGRMVTVFSSQAIVGHTDGDKECFSLDVDLSERKRAEAAIRDSEQRYRSMIEWTLQPMAVHRAGRLVYVNPATVRMIGASSADELLGRSILDWIHPDSRELVLERARQVAQTGENAPLTSEKYIRMDGGVIDVEAQATQILFDGAPANLVSMQDVTRRNLAARRLQLAAQVFDNAREGIMVTDPLGTIVEVNAAFTRITGYTREDVLGQNPRMLSSGRQGKEYYAAMWQALRETGNWTGEVWNRTKDGRLYAELQTISTVRDIHGDPINYVSLFSDITAAKEHAQHMERIAHYDALTNLPNRVLLADRLHQAMVQAQRRGLTTAVAFLDLDGFKGINDRHGHDVGDQLLVALAQHMRHALREGDTLARMGGDEFVAVMVDLPTTQACVPLLSRLLQAAAQSIAINDQALQVTASLGVTFYPQGEEVDADQLLRQADQAMYQAKLSGKNRYHVFDTEQDRHVRGHHESLDRVRSALLHDEFVLHYQPKVNMHSGEVIGAEALIRWQHPDHGLLPPAQFLPIVEDHPLAIDIGQWVLQAALQQLSAWNAAGLQVAVSVNIGARQLQQPQFVEHLQTLLAAHPQVQPQQLELEVLETSALEDLAHVSSVIQSCSAIGVGFSLDDFGTGYSSLSYLKRLPARQLKIDQSFVRDMLDDPDDLAILDGVIGLASAFRREVIAEGVETIDHGTLLLQLGCELGQGYGIARPMPAAQLAQWVRQWAPCAAWQAARRVHREDFALLYVPIEHRAWCREIEAFVHGERGELTEKALRECRFSRWINREGAYRFAQHPAFVLMDSLHERLHAHARTVHALALQGDREQAKAGLAELHALQESLAVQIGRLLEQAA